MSLKITGIAFSPRTTGNSEIAVKEIAHQISGAELTFFSMHDHHIKPCAACYRCLADGGSCPLDDDTDDIIQQIASADALIFAVPSYFMGPNGLFKNFIDRFLMSYQYMDRLADKPVVLVSIYGVEGHGEGYVDLALKATANVLNLDVKGSAEICAALPGEIMLNETSADELKRLAGCLIEVGSCQPEGTCEVCGSDYFRFKPDQQVQCMICKNVGTIGANGLPKIEQTGTFFGSEKELMLHKDWLLAMKARFHKEKARLFAVMKAYS